LIPRPSTLAVLVAGKKASGILGGHAPTEPRIENRRCDLSKTWGEKKTDLPTNPKWQIGLGLWQKVARRETERSAASAKRAATTHRGIPKGAALGAPLVTFPASGKSPGVEGRSALLIGRSAEEGPHLWCTPPRIVKLGDAAALPVKNYPNNSVQISGISGSSVRTTSLPKSSAVSPSRRRRATTTSRASANS
jgi:hypothetical protein